MNFAEWEYQVWEYEQVLNLRLHDHLTSRCDDFLKQAMSKCMSPRRFHKERTRRKQKAE